VVSVDVVTVSGDSGASWRQITIVVPLPDPALTINARRRMHWREERRHVKAQREAAMLAAYAAMSGATGLRGVLFPTGKVRADVEVFRRPRQKEPDEPAKWEMLKPVWDGFEDAGIVADDKQIAQGDMVWWPTNPEPQIVITLSEVGQ
jgi:Holliday junction resolvase RusA-like endonuclease